MEVFLPFTNNFILGLKKDVKGSSKSTKKISMLYRKCTPQNNVIIPIILHSCCKKMEFHSSSLIEYLKI